MLESLDWLVLAAYFVLVFAIAIWSWATQGKSKQQSAEYFLAGRHAGWFVIGASLFASNIGAEHLIGLAGTGAASGVAVGQFEVLASLMLLILAWVFVPIYIKSGVFTMPEFLEKRYSPAARWYLAIVSIISYVLTKISVTVAAGGIVFESLMGISFWTGALIVVLGTGIYTIFGGLRAVLYTDMVQMFVFLISSGMIVVLGLKQLGGWDQMVALSGPDFMNMWKPISDPAFPWTGIILGAPILGIWYWCTDQFIVQRVLSGRNLNHARGGAVFAGFLKLLPLFLFVIPGLIAHGLHKQGFFNLETPDQALPLLMATVLPVGLKGVAVAGLLAALMSSLSSVFNSCSALITCDVYKKLKPRASDKQLVIVGQVSTAALVVFGLLWIPVIKSISGQLYQYLQSVQAYISPPIAAVFLLGVLWTRANSIGAISALWLGFVLGMGRLILELNKSWLTPGSFFHWFAEINFLHFAFFLFVLCSLLQIVLSLVINEPKKDISFTKITRQTSGKSSVLVPGLSVLLLACVASIWLYFS